MKGPIAVGIGRFLNAFGIRDPVGFGNFEDNIQPSIELINFYANANEIRNGNGIITLNAVGIAIGGTSPVVPEGELWYVNGLRVGVSIIAGSYVKLRPVIAGLGAGFVNKAIPCDVVESDPARGVASNRYVESHNSAPFLMRPGDTIGVVVFDGIVFPYNAEIALSYWQMRVG